MKIFFLLSILVICTKGFGQLNTVSISQLDSLQNSKSKPVYIFMHTDWCKVCLMMEETSLKDKKVINLLNEHFYVVFYNPEKEKITEKLSDLASEKTYPSSFFLNPNFQLLTKKEGLLKKEALQQILETIISY